MGYLSLYRKWRPQKFSDIVGQDNVIQTLKNAIELDRIAHAYLFCGPRGTGKTSTAKILAKSLNCVEGPTLNPCEECEPCQKIQDNGSIDVIEIDAASNRGIDEIRELREKVKFFPTEGNYKVYIIDEAHMLTKEAFNALLKTLEEPPEYVIFILATTEPHSLLPTILSRCQRFDFNRLSVQNIIKRLKFICQQEGVELTTEAAVAIARSAEGGMRDAISILDQIISYSGDQIELSDVATVLGLVEREILFKMVEVIAEKEINRGLELVKEIINQGKDVQQFVNSLIDHFRNLLIQKECQQVEGLIELPEEQKEKIKQQASKLETEELLRLTDILIDLETALQQSDQPRILLEMGIIKLIKPEANTSQEGILDRLTRLEKMFEGGGSPVFEKDQADQQSQQIGSKIGQEPKKEKVKDKEAKNKEVKKDRKTPKVKDRAKRETKDERGNDSQKNLQLSKLKEKWSELLEYIRSNEPMTYAVLREGNLVAVNGKKIVLEFEKDKSFHQENVERKKQEIEEIIRKVLGKEMKISVTKAKSNEQQVAKKEKPSNKEKKREQKEFKKNKNEEQDGFSLEIKRDPLVKKVLEVFDGKILKVKES